MKTLEYGIERGGENQGVRLTVCARWPQLASTENPRRAAGGDGERGGGGERGGCRTGLPCGKKKLFEKRGVGGGCQDPLECGGNSTIGPD